MKYPIGNTQLDPVLSQIQRDAERDIKERVTRLLKNGYRAHSYRYKPLEGMKHDVCMVRHIELNTVIELVSEPFDTELEAQHFANVFNDCF